MDLKDLYRLHSESVYNLALNYLQNIQDAEEVTQDVFLAVHHHLAKFRGEAQIKTWIYRITINKCLDVVKSRKSIRHSFLSLWKKGEEYKYDQYSISDFEHPGVELEQREATTRIFSAINKLPENQKNVLMLLKLEGLSQAEVAEIVGTSTKAVESLFQRAKANLEKILNFNEGKS